MFSVKEAADLVGRTKSALNQKIKLGKLSATRDSNGHWKIDPSELERVFGKLTTSKQVKISDSNHQPIESHKEELITELQRQLEQQAKEIEDWKRRYDQVNQERKEQAEKVTALLTNQNNEPKGILRRLFR